MVVAFEQQNYIYIFNRLHEKKKRKEIQILVLYIHRYTHTHSPHFFPWYMAPNGGCGAHPIQLNRRVPWAVRYMPQHALELESEILFILFFCFPFLVISSHLSSSKSNSSPKKQMLKEFPLKWNCFLD